VGLSRCDRLLAAGAAVFQPGLLAEAIAAFLYVDERQLLLGRRPSPTCSAAVAVARTGIEREPQPLPPCRTLLIATYNPKEGAVRDHLLDRFAIVPRPPTSCLAMESAGLRSPAPPSTRPAQQAFAPRWQEETEPWPPSCCWPAKWSPMWCAREQIVYLVKGGPARRRWKATPAALAVRWKRAPCGPVPAATA